MTAAFALLLAGSVVAPASLSAAAAATSSAAMASPSGMVAGRHAAASPPPAPAASNRNAESAAQPDAPRPRARDLGIEVGVFQPGEFNAITDVEGVLVGHATIIRGDSVRTGVTAIRPHGGNLFVDRVPAAIHAANGFGKLLGVTQVRELGELETPVLLTCTLCVWKAADGLVQWMLEQRGMEDVRSINPVVGETNDGGLNDIRARPVSPEDVRAALDGAAAGLVEEGAVGAGTGTSAFGWKGGIGTSSRVLPASLGGYTVGVLVQSNFGGILQILGAPVGRELGRYAFSAQVGEADAGDSGNAGPDEGDEQSQGSIMMVVATDAPLSERNLQRVARRAVMGLARTGSFAGNGSGDYAIGFSTAPAVRRRPGDRVRSVEDLSNGAMSAIFQATVEATEEAIYNSLFGAATVSSRWGTREALPLDAVMNVLERYGAIRR
jgi:D-aminopeptidase